MKYKASLITDNGKSFDVGYVLIKESELNVKSVIEKLKTYGILERSNQSKNFCIEVINDVVHVFGRNELVDDSFLILKP